MTPIGNENIRWLNVAVNDPLRVGRIKRVSDLDGWIEKLLRLERFASNAVLECLALELKEANLDNNFVRS